MAGIINVERIKKQLKTKVADKLSEKAEESSDNLSTLWNYELAQEIAAHSPNLSAIEAIEPYVYPRFTREEQDGKVIVKVSFDPEQHLHPGLDTLAYIAYQNIITKFKYTRGGNGNA